MWIDTKNDLDPLNHASLILPLPSVCFLSLVLALDDGPHHLFPSVSYTSRSSLAISSVVLQTCLGLLLLKADPSYMVSV